MRAHPVGEGLDERRALAGAGGVERGLGHGVHGEHVVAVDPDAGEAEAAGALVERDAGLLLDGLGDGPLVVLAEEHDRAVVDAGEDERLVDVALAGRAVAEVGDDGGVAVGVAGADAAVALHAHRVAGGVQGLGADDDRVEVEVLLVRVPAAVVDAAEHAEQVDRVDAAAPGDAVLAVGREGVVLGAQRAAGADLGGLLAEQAGPQAELALALERGGLGVEAADEDEVAVEPAQLLVVRSSTTASYSGCETRSPSGLSSWTISGPPSWTGRSGASAPGRRGGPRRTPPRAGRPRCRSQGTPSPGSRGDGRRVVSDACRGRCPPTQSTGSS